MGIENTKIIFLRSNNVDHSGAFGMTVNDILCDKCSEDLKRLICCEYQRPYTWKGDDQIIELIRDIEKKCEDNKFHFIGILYFGSGNVNHGKPIIDGQQRLITLFLILYYLRVSNNFSIEIKIDDIYRSLNEVIEDENISKQSTLLNEYKKSIGKVLKKLGEYFHDKDRNFKENFVYKLLNKLYFLAIVCTDKKMEQQLFMDINSKGIKLDDIDQIKAFLLSIYKDNLPTFIKQWAFLNKRGKESINLFLKILMNALCGGTDSTGKVKYEKFIKKIHAIKVNDKNLSSFRIKFNQAIERFKIIPYDEEMFAPNFKEGKFDRNLKNIYASIHLARSLKVFTTFAQEITHEERFNDYVNGKRSPIILFLLYILSYICELNFSFKNSDSRRKIKDFQNWDEKTRKKEVLRLWTEVKKKDGECLLNQIEYRIPGINDDHLKIIEKSKCIFSLLIISLSKYLDFYDQIKNNRNAHVDHIIPKKILFKKEPNIPKNRKSLTYKFNSIDDDEELEKLICSIYNMHLMSESGNKGKSSSLDEKFCIKDDTNKIIGINYKIIKDFLNKNKEELIKNLDEVILKLTK